MKYTLANIYFLFFANIYKKLITAQLWIMINFALNKVL